MTPKAREILHTDAEKLQAYLLSRSAHNFTQLRTSALVLLAWGAALRLSEVLALDVDQVLEEPKRSKLARVRATGYLRTDQAERPGAFIITTQARAALGAYLRALIDREWLTLPAQGVPLWVTVKGGRNKGAPSRTRLGKRAAQLCLEQALQGAGVVREPYRFGDLRHDALTKFGASCRDPFAVAQFGRMGDARTAARYVPHLPSSLAQLASTAEAAVK